MKKGYKKGGIGDGRIKKFLFEVLDAELKPVREKRLKLEGKEDELMAILKVGTDKANKVADETLAEVKKAMGIDYFGAK